MFDRNELENLLPNLAEDKFEILIEEGGAEAFGMVDIPNVKPMPVKKQDRPPLKRQMSAELLQGTAPQPAAGNRRFFRTWVRIEPITKTTNPAVKKE